MKKVLVLGAGLVSKPLVRYLLDHNFHVTIASRTKSKADKLIDGHPNGSTASWLVEDTTALEKVKRAVGDEWEEEFYWIATESTPALEKAGFKVEYIQVSSCAGVFSLQP